MMRQQRQTRQARNTYYITKLQCEQLPLDANPVTVDMVGARVILRGSSSINEITNEEIEEQDSYNWEQYGWPTRNVTMAPDNGEEFAALIRRGEAKAICDGSYKQGYSSSAFLTMNTNSIHVSNIVPGRKQDQSSYRGELGGIYGLVVMTKAVCKKHDVMEGAITIGCDNEDSIKALNNGRTPNCNCLTFCVQLNMKLLIHLSNGHSNGLRDIKMIMLRLTNLMNGLVLMCRLIQKRNLLIELPSTFHRPHKRIQMEGYDPR